MNIIDEFGLDEDNFVWQDLAMCLGTPPQAHFEDSESPGSIVESTKSICDYCPVKAFCLEEGLRTKSEGIWGGKRIKGGKVVE